MKTHQHAFQLSFSLSVLLAALVPAIAAPEAVPLRKVASGTHSGILKAEHRIVRTEAEWKPLWARHQPSGTPPKADFSREMLVCAFLGTRSTTGYGIRVVSVVRKAGQLLVTLEETTPPPGAFTGQMITSPYAIVAVPKSDLPVKWKTARLRR